MNETSEDLEILVKYDEVCTFYDYYLKMEVFAY